MIPSDLLNFDVVSLLWIVLRTFVVYVVLIGGLRIFGKRELGQMTPFDLVVILTVSNAVQNAMIGSDVSVTGATVSVATLLFTNWLFNEFGFRSPGFRKLFLGQPRLLVHNGEVLQDNLRREGLDEDDVIMAAREHGFEKMGDIGEAMLELDGSISIIPKDTPLLRTKHRKRQVHR
jgi:uncharacterized membrane protein YcaP (DUF421 family)